MRFVLVLILAIAASCGGGTPTDGVASCDAVVIAVAVGDDTVVGVVVCVD